MTPDQALAQIMILFLIKDDAEKRMEIRKVLQDVRASGYGEGYIDGLETGQGAI